MTEHDNLSPDRQAPHDASEHRGRSWVILVTVLIVALAIIGIVWGVFYHAAG